MGDTVLFIATQLAATLFVGVLLALWWFLL